MRTHRFAVFVLCSAAVAFATMARADEGPITPGTLAISPTLAFSRTAVSPPGGGSALSQTRVNAAAVIGRYISDRVQLNTALLGQHQAMSGRGLNGIGGSLGATVDFTPQGAVTPFFSASIGAISYTHQGITDRALLAPMLRVGFRAPIAAARTVDVSFGYQHEANKESTFESSSDTFELGVGVSIFRPHSD
jgi:hypothetical protein